MFLHHSNEEESTYLRIYSKNGKRDLETFHKGYIPSPTDSLHKRYGL